MPGSKAVMEPLIAHMRGFIAVPEPLEQRLSQICVPLSIDKGTLLHSPGKVCEHTYFILSGLLRIHYLHDGREVTDNFCAEGEWITSIYSFMRHIPDHFHIEALEPSELLAIPLQALEQCFRDFPAMERFGRMLISQYFMDQSERILSLQFHTAKEKYEHFCKTWPNKHLRLPLGMLASHLGMTQETLSRIRSGKTAF
jgi:CRP-like cAMP-binding protein